MDLGAKTSKMKVTVRNGESPTYSKGAVTLNAVLRTGIYGSQREKPRLPWRLLLIQRRGDSGSEKSSSSRGI